MSKTLIPLIMAGILLAGVFTSCRYNPLITHTCDTCNLNQDSLERIKDSLAHAFTWQQYSIPGEGPLTGVWVFGPNDIMICGNSLWHFDGTNFSLIHCIRNGTNPVTMDGSMNGLSIFAFSQTEFWLVQGSIAYHTIDGHHFDDFRPGSSNACWGSSPNDVFVVGNGGQIHHFDGTQFTQMNSGTIEDLRSIWGIDHNHVWACGTTDPTFKTVIEFYDGNNWIVDDFSNSADALSSSLSSTWTADSMITHEVVVASGTNIFRRTDNNLWRQDSNIPNKLPDGTPLILGGLCGNSPNDLFVIGWQGWIGHWNGKTWMRYDTLYDAYNKFNMTGRASSVEGNTVCVVGSKNNQSWVAIGTRKP